MSDSSQITIAQNHGIPFAQVSTINPKKALDYYKWLNSPKQRLECWLDDRCLFYLKEIGRESM